MKNLRQFFECSLLIGGVVVLVCSAAHANEVAAPNGKIVIPRMVSSQTALNNANGGQITLITSNGYLQGPTASMAQIVANHLGAVTNLPAFTQGQGPANPVTPGSGPRGGSVFPTLPGVVAGQAVFPVGTNSSGGAPQIGTGAINWQSFNIGSGSAAQIIPSNAGSIVLNATTGQSSSVSILGTLVSNGHIITIAPGGLTVGAGAIQVNAAGFVPPPVGGTSMPSGLTVGAGAVQLNAATFVPPPVGAISITSGSGAIGSGTAVTGVGVRPPSGVTLR